MKVMPLHTETVRLSRVFDVQRLHSSRSSPARTLFSFESEGKKYYSVQVPGWPKLEPDHTLVVVLRAEGNWQTVIAARNLSTGESATPDVWRSFIGIFTGLLNAGLLAVHAKQAETTSGKTISIVFLCLCIVFVIALIAQALEQRKAIAMLSNF